MGNKLLEKVMGYVGRWAVPAHIWYGEWTTPAPVIERDENDILGFPYEDGISCPLCGDFVDKYRPCRKRIAKGV